MYRRPPHALQVTRRHFFADCGVGVGKIALGALLGESFRREHLPELASPASC